jgi:hypothetical protein
MKESCRCCRLREVVVHEEKKITTTFVGMAVIQPSDGECLHDSSGRERRFFREIEIKMDKFNISFGDTCSN